MLTEEEQADAAIADFDTWFRARGNDPLVGSERAILKTFLWYLEHGKTPAEAAPEAAPKG
jgi:hypothetical protein